MKSKKPEKIDEAQKLIKVTQAVEECLDRMPGEKDREYWKQLLIDTIMNRVIPLELISRVPVRAVEAGKTRFDQFYDAVMEIVFPGYQMETLQRFLGPAAEISSQTKIWRAVFPEKFQISHVFLRATNFQRAFAYACDYACRVSLRMFRSIPPDLTIRVMFVSERSLCRMLDIRWSNRTSKRRKLRLNGRDHTRREIAGAQKVALGSPKQPEFRVIKYAERKDLDRLYAIGKVRLSEVEWEWYKK